MTGEQKQAASPSWILTDANFYNAGTFSIELSKEQLESLGIQIWNILPNNKHDATIAAAAITEQLHELLDWINNADNHFHTGTETAVTIHNLVDWIASKGVTD